MNARGTFKDTRPPEAEAAGSNPAGCANDIKELPAPLTPPLECQTPTYRPSSAGLDAILGQRFPVLDHGFVRVVDYMGNDAAIVQAARVSYGDGTKTPSDDAALINYLMRKRHTSPMEMAEIKLHVKLPIFVARQWIRHRTASVNEVSGRYSMLPSEFYVPSLDAVRSQSKANKQGRDGQLPATTVDHFLNQCEATIWGFQEYTSNMEHGIARELARINLPLSTYTEIYWKIDLHNLFNFLQQRLDEHAQWEIREYAGVIFSIVRQWVPIACEAFAEHRLYAHTFSLGALAVLRRMLNGEHVPAEERCMSKREWNELMKVLGT